MSMSNYLLRTVVCVWLAGCGFGAVGAQASPGAPTQRPDVASESDGERAGELVVGVRHVVPPFVAGSKVRTPENIETLLVDEVAKSMQRTPRYIAADASSSSVSPETFDFVVADLPKGSPPVFPSMTAIATGQVTRPMAIMRTDTDIKSWTQLKGRTVCLAEDGKYVGKIAQQYGAIEQVYRAPADSLLALRIGECDAAVHDDTMLKALLRFPEWKKFSASLPPGNASAQYFLVPAQRKELANRLRKLVAGWQSKGYYGKLIADMTHDIAFEVYLDQTVPDCH